MIIAVCALPFSEIKSFVKLMIDQGGYHDYESIRPIGSLEEKLYSCGYLQYVDTFVYFSHKLVCVPPPTWTNSMHRNGVKVLGTFMLEPGKDHIEQMFDKVDGEYIVARQLARMSHFFGFDGWLLNIEEEIPSSIPNVKAQMLQFIGTLRRLLGKEGRVIWYDALTSDNEVDYQNGLTPKNFEFAVAADAILTNYKWVEKDLINAKLVAQWNSINVADVYFGIDVWAQNTDMVSYPLLNTFFGLHHFFDFEELRDSFRGWNGSYVGFG